MNEGRNLITLEDGQFPTDNYIADGLSQLLGADRCRTQAVDIAALTPETLSESAALLLSHVDYKSGALRDMNAITTMAQSVGCLVIWDLAHSAGAINMDLEASQADFAVGCTYKFLNGGPGAPGFLYVAERHQEVQNPLPGWMGHARLFDFEAKYEAAPGIKRFLTGTQSVLALSAVSASLSVFEDSQCRTSEREASRSRDISLRVGSKARYCSRTPRWSHLSMVRSVVLRSVSRLRLRFL